MTKSVREQKPVAWRCKDFADSWILFNSEGLAKNYHDSTGCLIEPLYLASPDLSKAVEALKILFPDEEQIADRSFVDHSADGNIEAVIVDLEMRGADPVCIRSLRKIEGQLSSAREALAHLTANKTEE